MGFSPHWSTGLSKECHGACDCECFRGSSTESSPAAALSSPSRCNVISLALVLSAVPSAAPANPASRNPHRRAALDVSRDANTSSSGATPRRTSQTDRPRRRNPEPEPDRGGIHGSKTPSGVTRARIVCVSPPGRTACVTLRSPTAGDAGEGPRRRRRAADAVHGERDGTRLERRPDERLGGETCAEIRAQRHVERAAHEAAQIEERVRQGREDEDLPERAVRERRLEVITCVEINQCRVHPIILH